MLMLRKIAPRLATTRSALTGLVLLTTLAAGQESAGDVAAAQDNPGRKTPSVSMAPSPIITVTRGKSNPVNLRFRVGSGFHVNSNQPRSEFLIPTVLKLSAPTDIVIGRVGYPAGSEMSFTFAPEDKLSVYTGEFPVVVEVRPLAEVIPAKYMIRGELKYQACDKAACYPPKKLPVQFEVNVIKGPPPHRKNPGQSPHVHL
jgi:Disulphide bond corrector protein DsbC